MTDHALIELSLAVVLFTGCSGATPSGEQRVVARASKDSTTRETRIVELNARNFDRLVLEATGPVLVEFGSSTCAACLRMAPDLERLANEYHERALVGHVDVDAEVDLAQRMAVHATPVLLLFVDGEFVRRLDGERDADELRELLVNSIRAESAPPTSH